MKHKGTKSIFDDSDLAGLQKLFSESGIPLSDYQLNQFMLYYKEIVALNSKLNLVSKNDEKRIFERHFLESSVLSLFSELKGAVSVLDLGSGGGFPGVPIKIVNPDIALMLIDSKRLKTIFLNNLVNKLKLNNTHVLCMRAEDANEMIEYSNTFDVVVSRAVAELSIIYNWAQPFLKSGGCLISIKGSNLSEEMKEFSRKFPQLIVKTNSMPVSISKRSKRQKIVFIRKENVI